jgi:hypothetical protein
MEAVLGSVLEAVHKTADVQSFIVLTGYRTWTIRSSSQGIRLMQRSLGLNARKI